MKEGWICPKCGKVLAPWVPECDCYKQSVNPTYTGTQPNVYEPAPYWTNPDWKAPTPMCSAAKSEGE